MSEYYSRDGIMIYRNGFRIAECDTEELAENILNHLQSPQEVTQETEKRLLLKGYSEYLEEHGYMDSDWREEEPFAIDEFLLDEKKNANLLRLSKKYKK